MLYNLIILGGAIAVAAEVKQVRKNHRVPSALPGLIQLSNGHVLPIILSDFSEGGVGIQVKTEHEWVQNEPVNIILARGEQRFSFPGRVSRTVGNSLGIRFDALSQQQHINMVQCTFARADSWLVGQNKMAPDAPMNSLNDIIRTSFRGYQQMARHLPFPLSMLVRWMTGTLGWCASLLPKRAPDALPLDPIAQTPYL